MRKHPEPIRSKKPPRMLLYRCCGGHIFFHAHPSCPTCGEKLYPARTSGKGILLSHTTTEITQKGAPLTLCIVRHRGGAQSLCRIIGEIRGNGRDRVSILWIDGRFYAFGRSARVAYRGFVFRSLQGGSDAALTF